MSEIVSSSNPNMCERVASNSAKSTTSEHEQQEVVASPPIDYGSEEIVIDYELVQIEIRYALLVSICITSSLITLIIEFIGIIGYFHQFILFMFIIR